MGAWIYLFSPHKWFSFSFLFHFSGQGEKVEIMPSHFCSLILLFVVGVKCISKCILSLQSKVYSAWWIKYYKYISYPCHYNLRFLYILSEINISCHMKPRSSNQFLPLMTVNENNWVAKYIDWFCFYYLDCLKKCW